MESKRSPEELKVSIGGIVISVRTDGSNRSLRNDDAYRAFLTNDNPEVNLRLHHGSGSKYELKKKVFDTGTTWSMFSAKCKYILIRASKSIVLDSDFRSGDIYINSQEAGQEGEFPLNYPLDEVLMINLLAKGRGVMVHACGVKDSDNGLLFAATCQGGKSTMANLWKKSGVQVAESRSQGQKTAILSDDRVIIRKINGRFWMYGTPWHGDVKVCSPEMGHLEKIFFLKHAKKNSVKEIEPIDAASRLVVCSFPTFWDKKGMEFTLGFIDELTKEVSCYDLGFLPDESVIDFVKNI